MKQIKTGLKTFTSIFATLMVFSSLGCNIGLGTSVDTEKPKVSIDENLTSGKVVKEAFILSGTCSDDTGVGRIQITLSNSDTGLIYEYTIPKDQIVIQVGANGEKLDASERTDSWSVKLNERPVLEDGTLGEYPLGDGKYNISVTAYDVSSEEGKASITTERTIVIDNTAPLLVLSRPAIGDSYGRFFTISGRVADDANIDTMEIDVFSAEADENAAPLYTIVKNNIAPSIDIDAAVFGQEGENGPYEIIYGKEPDQGTKTFKCKIRVYDAARTYPPVEGDKGNCSSVFHLDEDAKVSTYISSFTVSDMYHILNGTYAYSSDRTATDDLRKEVETWLKNPAEAHETSSFKLNPENSPKFALIGGFSAVENYEGIRGSEILNEDSIVLKVEAGTDGIPLLKDTIGIYFTEVEEDYSVKSENGKNMWKVVEGFTPVAIMKPYKDFNGKVLLDDAELAVRNQSAFESQGTSYTISSKVYKELGLKIGGAYIVTVTGYDESGNAINNLNTYYGVYLNAKGLAPTLKVTEPATNTQYLKKDSTLVIVGTLTHDIGKPDVTITFKKYGTDETKVFSSAKGEITVSENQFKKTFNISDFVANGNENAQYDISIIGNYGEYVSGEVQKIAMYDINPPEISQITVSPIADTKALPEGHDHNVNGIITLSGSFNDAASDSDTGINVNTMKCVYTSKDGKKEIDISKQQNWKIDIDTRNINDGPFEASIEVEDKAGNKSTRTVFFNDDTQTKYEVNQASDNPLIIMEEQVVKVNSSTDSNITPLAKRHTLTGTLTDDDGFEKVTVYVYDLLGNLLEGYGVPTEVNGSVSYQLSKQLPDKDGVYKVKVEATDKKPNREPPLSPEASVSTSWESYVKIAGDAPTISVKNGNNSVLKSTASLPLTLSYSGSVADGDLKIYLLKEEDKKSDKSKWNEILSSSDAVKTEDVTVPSDKLPLKTEGSNSVIIRIVANGLVTDDVLTYRIDNEIPNPPTVEGWGETNKITSGTNQIRVYATDNGLAGISKLYYRYDIDNSDENDVYTWNVATGTGPFDIFQKFGTSDIQEGRRELKLNAEDAAGNLSGTRVYVFVADTSAPDLELKKDSVDISNTTITTAGDYTFNIKATDTQSGIVSIKINGTVISAEDFSNKNYTLTETGTYTVETENGSGLKTSKNVTVTIDAGNPTITITSPASDDEWQNSFNNITVSGSADDGEGTGIQAVYYRDTVGEAPAVSVKSENLDESKWTNAGWTKLDGTVSWKNEGQSVGNAEGENVKTISVIAVDRAGNISGKVTRKINIDTAIPEIKDVTGLDSANTNYMNADFTLSGKVSDTYKVQNLTVKWGNADNQKEVININAAEGTWSKTFNLGEGKILPDGNWTITVDAQDVSGKAAASKIYSVIADKTKPVSTEFNTPNRTDTTKSSFKFTGKITETGSGLKASTMKLKISDDSGHSKEDYTISGTDNWSSKVDFTGDVFASEGIKTYELTAEDNAGNVMIPVTGTFVYDKANPTWNMTTSATGMPKAGLTLTGNAGDSYKLSRIEIKQERVKNGSVVSDSAIIKNIGSEENPLNTTSNAVSQEIPFNASGNKANVTESDGDYKYTITVYDTVGNSVTDSFTLTPDTTAPTVTITTSDALTGDNSISTQSYTFTGTASDPGSALINGVKNIYWQIQPEGTAVQEADWSTLINGSPESWQISKTFENQGKYTLYVKADDKAGNMATGDGIKHINFTVDYEAPKVTLKINDKNDSEIKQSSTNDNQLSFVYTATDSWALASNQPVVTVKKDSVVLNANKYTKTSGKITFVSPEDGEYSVTVSATDKAGRTPVVETKTIKLDTTGPEITITTPTEENLGGWFKSNSILFSGAASDAAGSNISGIYYSTDSTAPDSDLSDSKWIRATGSENWRFTLSQSDTSGQSLKISAKDSLGNITPVSSYTIKVDTKVPELQELAVTDELINKTEYNALNLTVTAKVKPTASGTNKVELYNGSTLVASKTTKDGTEGEYDKYEFTVTDKSKLTSGSNSSNKITVRATNNAETVGTSAEKVITVDTEAPTVSNYSVSPVVNKDGVDYVNGKVNVSVTVADTRKLGSDVEWTFGEGVGKSGTVTGVSGISKIITFEVDTTKLTDNTENTLTLTVTDEAGNEKVDNTFKLNVKQSTDKPEIEAANFTLNVSESGVTESVNLFEISDNKIRATITDDDGLSSVKVKYKKSGDPSYTEESLSVTSGAKTYNMEYALPTVEAKYDVIIEAVDINENPGVNNKASETTYVGVLTKVPSVTLKTKNTQYSKNGSAVNIEGKFDGGASSTFKRKYKIGNGSESAETVISDKDFTDVLTLSITENTVEDVTVTYKASNIFGQEAVETYVYTIDDIKPVFSGVKVKAGASEISETEWYKEDGFDLSGTLTDTGSGIKEIKYWINQTGTEPDSSVAENGKIIPLADGTFTQILAELADGENSLYLKGYDKAGNETATFQKFTIKYDNSEPTLTLNESAMGLTNDTVFIKRENLVSADAGTGAFIKGTISDSGSGVSKVKVMYGDVEVISGTNTSINLKLDASKLKIEGTSVSEYKFNPEYALTIVGTDNCNNSVKKDITLVVDTEEPVIDIPTVTKYVTANDKENNVNGTISISGNVSDDDKINSLSAVLKKGGADIATLTVNSSKTRYSIEDFDTTAGALADYTGDISLVVTATDRVGRTKTYTETLYVDQSTDLPTFTSSYGTTNKENLFGMSKWKFTGTAGDDDGVDKVEIKIDSGEYAEIISVTGSKKTSQPFTYSIPEDTAEGDHTVKIRITDINGKSKEISVNIAVDNSTPTVRVNKIAGSSYSSGMFVKGSFVVDLEVTDINGINKVQLTKINGVELETAEEISKSGSYYTRIFTTSGDLESEEYTFTVKAIDNYDRSNELTAKVTVDRKSPEIDKSQISVTGGSKVITLDSDEDKLTGEWFNSREIRVAGSSTSINDENINSSVSVVVTGATTDSSSTEMSAGFNVSNSMEDGVSYMKFTFKDRAGNEAELPLTLSVDTAKPVATGTKQIKAGANVLSSTDVSNTDSLKVEFTAKDNNSTHNNVSGIKRVYFGGVNGFEVDEDNKDTVTSEYYGYADVLEESFTVYATETQAVEFKFFSSASDANTAKSNEDSVTKADTFGVKLEKGSADGTYTDVYAWTGKHYPVEKAISGTADISKAPDGTRDIYVRIVDGAGNISSSERIGSFKRDSTAPKVTVNFGAANDADTIETGIQVNKTIVISGTSTDENAGTSEPSLKVYKTDENGKKTGDAVSKTGLVTSTSGVTNSFASWSFTVDTTKLTTTTEDNDKDYVFEVEVSDAAGNKGTGSVTLNVDQKTDRPVIELEGINATKTETEISTIDSKVIKGTVSDDDSTSSAVVNKFEIQVRKATVSNTTPKSDVAGDSDKDENGNISVLDKWVTLTVGTDKKFSYTVPGDGNYRIWFRVKDNKNGENENFTSGDSDLLKQPKVTTQNTSTYNTGDYVDYAVDTTAPKINSVKIALGTKSGETITYGTPVEFEQGKYYGGTTRRYAKVYLDVTEDITKPDDMEKKVYINNANPEDLKYENNLFVWEVDFGNLKDEKNTVVESGSISLTFRVKDKSNSEDAELITVFIDNVEPNKTNNAVTNVTPNAVTEVTGSVDLSAIINDDSEKTPSGVDASEVAYYIPKNNGKTGAEAVKETDASTVSAWSTANLTVSDVRLELVLDSLADGVEIVDDYAGYETSAGSGVYDIPVWFRITDNVGNTSYVTDKTIKYNPDMSKPHVRITYPEQPESINGKGYVVLGGNIRMTGVSDDNISVDGVYVQIDHNGDGLYNKKDIDWLKSATGGKYAATDIVKIPGTTGELTEITETGNFDNWGIKAKGDVSWNFTFDAKKLPSGATDPVLEIGNASNTDNKTLNMRVRATDTETPKRVSAWNEIHVSVNKSNPVFEKFDLVQYSNSTYINEIQRIDYATGVYVKGENWRLEGSVEDNDGISKIEKISDGTTTELTIEKTALASGKGYDLKIPVILSGGSTEFDIVLKASDTDTPPKTTEYQITVKVDNEAPAFKDGATDDTLEIFQGAYGRNPLSNIEKIQNSNGWTTLASKVGEAGSGFDKAIFYVERHSGTNEAKTSRRIYNVMEGHGEDNTSNRTDLSLTPGSGVYINEDGLPVLNVTSSEVTRSDEYTLVVNKTGIGNNKNIRLGGAVFFGGNYKIITSYTKNSADKITVKFAEEVDTTKYTTASFVYGMVVNNSGERLENDEIKYDDGDGIAESYVKSGTDYTWDVSFDSSNIPDGPAEIHVVVFDKAGNSRHGSIEARFSNNQPRITSVRLGTDLNRDDSHKVVKYTRFYAVKNAKGNADTSVGKEVWNLEPNQETETRKRDIRITNGLYVKPEFVGGTAPFYYVFSSASGRGSENASNRLTTPASGTNLSSETTATGAQGKFAKGGTIELPNSVINVTNGEDNVNTYRFSFWDSTEESTPGTDTGWCILNVDLKQDTTDTDPSKPYVHPFYWNGREDNSLAWSGGKPQGHIELKGAITDDIKNITVSGTTLGDDDPKVSGTVVIRGTAYDESNLRSVKLIFDAGSVEATYDGTTWTPGLNAEKGASLSVTDLNGGLSQDGHLVSWELTLDTTKGTSGKQTGLDKLVKVNSKDSVQYAYTNDSFTGQDEETENTVYYSKEEDAANEKYYAAEACTGEGVTINDRYIEKGALKDAANKIYEYKVYGTSAQYKMDVVPYVYEIETELNKLNTNNPSVYARNSLGHYSVRAAVTNSNKSTADNETITLKGWNLNGTVYVDGDSSPTVNDGEIKISTAALQTGELDVTVDGIKLMNNINNNEAKGYCNSDDGDDGEYTNCYNRTPNGDNNNLLTDDLYVDVWEINNRLVEPSKKSLGGTRMQVNSNNGLIQYAFSDGLYFSMGNSDTKNGYEATSSTQWVKGWDTVQEPSIGFHVDATGETVGCGHPSDSASGNVIDMFGMMTSRWGFGYTGQSYGFQQSVTNMKVLELTGEYHGNNNSDFVVSRKRIQSPSFASSKTDNSVNIYMAYYDALNNEIRFRAGEMPADDGAIKNGNNPSWGTVEYTPTETDAVSFDMYYDVNRSNNNIPIDTYIYDGNNPNLRRAQLLAGKSSTLTTKKHGAGRFVSIAVSKDTDDVVSAIWVDTTTSDTPVLRYSYKKNPMGNAKDNSNPKHQNDNTAAGWTGTKTLFENEGGGDYCKIVTDQNNGIHVVAYAGNGYLYYAYAKDYKSDFIECCVDATDGVGQHATLDIALNANGDAIPYIGYYSTQGKAKYAYLKDTVAEEITEKKNNYSELKEVDIKGVDENNRYTGNWVVSVVPTNSDLSIKDEDSINVGVWKDLNTGKIKNSTNGTSDYETGKEYTIKVGNDTSRKSKRNISKAYGNGTKNGVLVYQIVDSTGAKNNCLESAQMR